jgi:excinuclease UvrABC nuclease subunit
MMDNWQLPYINNKTTKRFSYKKPGIYLIRNKITKVITYIGMSKSNVYKALYRHFENWKDEHYRVVYLDWHNFEIWVILCDYSELAINTERRLIKRFKPADNREFYEDWVQNVPECYQKQKLEICPY